jgi:hypothetical protein
MPDEREVRALWRCIPRDERRIVLALAKEGRPHPDAAVRSMAVQWAYSEVARALLPSIVFSIVLLLSWSVLLSAFLRPAGVLFGALIGLVAMAGSMRTHWRRATDVLRSNVVGIESTTVRPTWLPRSSDSVAFGSKVWHKLALAFLLLAALGVLAALVAG